MTLPDWQPASSHPAPPDARLLDWLSEPGSLTRRLQSLGSFRVQVLNETCTPARADEAAALGIEPQSLVWAREVLLHSNDQPCIFARSVIAPEQRDSQALQLGQLGNRSLGDRLFNTPGMQRGVIEISRWPPEWLPDRWRYTACWARRSLFSSTDVRLLVCEVFLPEWPPTAAN